MNSFSIKAQIPTYPFENFALIAISDSFSAFPDSDLSIYKPASLTIPDPSIPVTVPKMMSSISAMIPKAT